MTRKSWVMLLALAILLSAVVACTRSTPTPRPIPTPALTPAVTPTPTLAPTPTPMPTSAPEPPAEDDPAKRFYDLAIEVPPADDFSTALDFEVEPVDNFSPQIAPEVRAILAEVFSGAKLTRVTNFAPLAPTSSKLEYVVRRQIRGEDINSLVAAFERRGYTKALSSVDGDDILLQVSKEGLELTLTNQGSEQEISVSASK